MTSSLGPNSENLEDTRRIDFGPETALVDIVPFKAVNSSLPLIFKITEVIFVL